MAEEAARLRALRRHRRGSHAQPFRDSGHHRTRPAAARHPQLQFRIHGAARRRADPNQAHRLHGPTSAGVPRRPADPQHRHRLGGQAGRRRAPVQIDRKHVREGRARQRRVRGLQGPRRRLQLRLQGNDRGQPRRRFAQRLRVVGAAHRPPDARPVQSRLRQVAFAQATPVPRLLPPRISRSAAPASAARSG